MQSPFDQIIAELRNTASAETQKAMNLLGTSVPENIRDLINMRMGYRPFFETSMMYFNDARRAII